MSKNRSIGPEVNRNLLFHDFVSRRYLMNRDKVRDVFENISFEEYLILHALMEKQKAQTGEKARIYLQTITEEMEITISAASKLARDLKDRGLVRWLHEGTGEEGTYVELTETGETLITKQEQSVSEFLDRVYHAYGADKAFDLMFLLNELENVMREEYVKLSREKQMNGGDAVD